MISKQRKAHKFIWVGIALVIPVLLFFTIKNLDFTQKPIVPQTEQMMVTKKEGMVQIQLNKPFQSPSALVYELDALGKQGQLIGQLDGMGSYTLPISGVIKGVLVLDGIQKEELYKIEF